MTLRSHRSFVAWRRCCWSAIVLVSRAVARPPTTCGSSRRRSFRTSGQIVGVRLRVGQDLLGDPLPRDPALDQSVHRPGCRGPQAARRTGRCRSGGLPARGHARPARHRLSQQPERGRADRGQIQSVPEGRRPRRGRGAQGQPQRDRRRGARDLLALREEPGAFGSAEREAGRPRAWVSRSSSSPSAIRTRSRRVRICPFA